MSAIVRVKTRDNQFIQGRILLDTCSTANFVTSKFAHRLRIPMRSCFIPVNAISSMNTIAKHSIQITFQSNYSKFEKTLTFLAIPEIANQVPSETFPRESIYIAPHLQLADPKFHLPQNVDLLIGSGPTLSLLSIGQVNMSRQNFDLYLQNTLLGWVVAGGTEAKPPVKSVTCKLTRLENQLDRFWSIEEVVTASPRSKEEIESEVHFSQTFNRDSSGR